MNMYYWLIGLVLAVISALFWPVLPSVLTILFLCLASPLLALLRPGFACLSKLLLFISGAAAGVVIMACAALPIAYWSWQFSSPEFLLAPNRYQAALSAEHSIKGRVITLQAPVPGKINLKLQLLKLDGESIVWPFQPLVRLSWYQPSTLLQQGDEISAKVKLKPAHGAMNLGSFNYQRWLWSQGVSGSGYIKALDSVDKNTTFRARWFERLQLEFAQAQFAQSTQMMALLFGFKDFSDDFWQELRRFGLSHLFAISGLHIGLAAGFSYCVLAVACRWLLYSYFFFFEHKNKFATFNSIKVQAKQRQSALLIQTYLPLFVSFFVACAYAALSGFAITTVRALIALLLVYGIRIFKLALSRSQVFILCVTILLFVSPLAIFSSGFWLSVIAVAVILYSLWRFDALTRSSNHKGSSLVFGLLALLRLQVLFLLLMLPLQIYFFSGVSYLAPLANLLAVPLFSLLIVPLLLTALSLYPLLPTLALSIFAVVDSILNYFWLLLTKIPATSGWLELHPKTALLALLIVSLLFMLQLPLAKRQYILLLLLIIGVWGLVTSSQRQALQAHWQVTVLDVGQGLSVVVEQNDHFLLYDTGAKYRSGFSWAKHVVLPYLEYKGSAIFRGKVKQALDYLIISHSDNDHSGGLDFILQALDVQQFISGENDITGGKPCDYQKIEWGTLTLTFFPGEKTRASEAATLMSNNRSCTLHIGDGRHHLLLPGDIEKKQESRLVASYAQQLKADVIVAPHHGSSTSSSAAFIEALEPTVNIFSSGFNNRWGFPHLEVLKRYQNSGVMSVNTADVGMVVIDFDDDISIKSYRNELAPYWYNQNISWPGWW